MSVDETLALPAFQCAARVSHLDGRTLGGRGDSDQIELEDHENGEKDKIIFELKVPEGFWKKAIVLFDPDREDGWTMVAEAEGGHTVRGEASMKDLRDNHLVLSKAKQSGHLRHIYNVTDAAATLEEGKRYQVSWNKE